MEIVTWNLRCPWKNADGKNAFIHRAGYIYDKIIEKKPQLIAFQEVVDKSLELLKRMLPEYEFFGTMRSANYDGEGVFIAVLKESFICLSAESFWLSPTPNVPGSRFCEQSDCPRVCSFVKLVSRKTKEIINVFNLHLDHISAEAQILGLSQVFDYVDARHECVDKDRTVILGDFNALPDSPTMEITRSKDWLYDATAQSGGTFHDYGRIEPVKIDYILISKALKGRVLGVEVWTDEHDGVYLSDHYPVCLKLTDN